MKVLYQPGDIVGDRYCIIGVLGEEATAVTYETAKLIDNNSSVAIKVLSLQ